MKNSSPIKGSTNTLRESIQTVDFAFQSAQLLFSHTNQNLFLLNTWKFESFRRKSKFSFFIPDDFSRRRIRNNKSEIFFREWYLFSSVGGGEGNELNRGDMEKREFSKALTETDSSSELDVEEVHGAKNGRQSKFSSTEVSLRFEMLDQANETFEDELLNTLPSTEEEFTSEHEDILRNIGWEVIESREDNPEAWDEAMKWLELRNGTYIPFCDPSPVVHMENVVPPLKKETIGSNNIQNNHSIPKRAIEPRKKNYQNNFSNSDVQVYMEDMCVQRLTIRTNNIDRSISFYSLLGFFPIARYTVNFQRATWLRLMTYDYNQDNNEIHKNLQKSEIKDSSKFVIELIQIPDPPLSPSKALNLIDENNKNIVGMNRFCIDITDTIRGRIDLFPRGLSDWLEAVNKQSQAQFGKKIKILQEPFQQMIYRQIIETCYISDDSGVIIEIMNRLRFLNDEEMMMDW